MDKLLKTKAEQYQLLEQQLNDLQEDYENAVQALRQELDEVNRGRLKRKMGMIETEQAETAQKIDQIEEFLKKYDILDVQAFLNKSDSEHTSLKGILELYQSELETVIESSYSKCLPNDWPKPIPSKLSGKLADLKDIPNPLKDLSPELRFIAYLVTDPSTPNHLVHSLTEWASAKSCLFESYITSLKEREKSPKNEMFLTSHHHPYLLIVLKPSPNKGKGYYLVNAWAIPNSAAYDPKTGKGCEAIELEDVSGEAIALAQIPEVIGQFLVECTANYLMTENPRVELFIPMDLMMEAADQWLFEDEFAFEPETIGQKFCVSIRSWERLMKRYSTNKVLWNEKWTVLESLRDTELLQRLRSGDANLRSGDKNDLIALLRAIRDSSALGLKVFDGLQKQEQYTDLIKIILQTALPLAIWLRKSPSSVNYQQEIEKLLACCIQDLPEKVREKRSSGIKADDDQHIGRHLSLLLEDPKRVPPIIEYKM